VHQDVIDSVGEGVRLRRGLKDRELEREREEGKEGAGDDARVAFVE